MHQIVNRSLIGNLIYKGNIILKYTINYPQIISSSHEECKDKFNNYYSLKAMNLETYCKNALFNEAKKTFDFNKEHNYPLMVYEVYNNYTISYIDTNIISLYSDEYTFTGGAHGNTIRTSQNWNFLACTFIPLAYFFSYNPYYIINILKQINKQISKELAKNPGIYFDNYCQLILDSFNLTNYYLSSDGVTVFFQQYDIAPYSTGIPEFKIVSNFN